MSESAPAPRCEGRGEIARVETPALDPRDPMFVETWWPCPGCVDCLLNDVLTADQVEMLDTRPEVAVFQVDERGVRLVGTNADMLGTF